MKNSLPVSLRRSALQCALSCSLMALSVPLMSWMFMPNVKLRYLATNYLYALVYSNCIGSLQFLVVPQVWVRSERYPTVAKWCARIATVASGATLGCLIANTLLMTIVGKTYNFQAEFLGSIKLSLVLSAAAVAFIATFDTYKYRLQAAAMQLKQKELERERAVSLMTKMRLSSLESRVHPHFLFNTINSISSLIHEDPERAEDMLTRMAALLRFSLESSETGLVPVERELKIVDDYLQIEKARFGERLRYRIVAEGVGLQGVLVPPLSIQTLVENSIKYAVNARKEGAFIRILLKHDSSDCLIAVEDDGPGFGSLTLLPGHGLDLLEERLVMLFGDSGRLQIKSTAKGASVSFTVSCQTPDRSGARREHEPATRVSGR